MLLVNGPNALDIVRDVRVQEAIAIDVTALAPIPTAMCAPEQIADLEETVVGTSVGVEAPNGGRVERGLMLGDAHPGGYILHWKLV